MKRVLLTETDPGTRAILDLILEPEGAELQGVPAGASPLVHARRWMPDLIVLGSKCGQENGADVVRALREDEVLANVPLLMISAVADAATRLEAFRAGVDEFITKPFDIAELEARLGTILRLDRYRALVEQRSRFERVAQAAPDGIVVLDASFHLHYLNPAAQAIVGKPLNPRRNFFEQCLERMRGTPTTVWNALAHGDISALEKGLFLQNNRGRTYVLIVHPSDEDGNGDSFLTLRDVTEEQTHRRLLWNLRDAIGHKLRTPLNGVVANLRMLKEMGHTLSAEDREDILADAVLSSERLGDTLERTSHFFEMAAPEPIEGTCSAQTFVQLFEALVSDHESVQADVLQEFGNGTIELQVPTPILESTLHELIANAVKFHPQGTPQLDLTLACDEEEVVVRLRDDGQTLTPEQLSQLGTPFYQAESCFTGEVPGCGLGLAGILQNLRMHGANALFANRATGPGFEVTLRLPAKMLETDPASASAPQA
ncbi:MAG: response regulator [Opitutales bacterium]